MRRTGRIALALSTLMTATALPASETITYTYDALGRLVNASSSGTVNSGLSASTSYDPAGNRSGQTVAGGAPQPPNDPPVAVNDAGTMFKCIAKTFAVLANDSDPDGNTPLALVSASGGGARGTPSISGTDILFTPNGLTGTASVTYVMRDALGATDSATLTITITSGGGCTDQ